MNTTKIVFGDGKYAIYHEDGANLRAYRYDHEAKGEPWRRLTGDGMILALVQRVEELQLALKEATELAEANRQVIDWIARGHPKPQEYSKQYLSIGAPEPLKIAPENFNRLYGQEHPTQAAKICLHERTYEFAGRRRCLGCGVKF